MSAAGRVVVRTPNHLGDLVMALPALEALDGADLLVGRALAPLLKVARWRDRVLPLERGAAGWSRAVVALRRGRYERGVLLTGSFSSALLLRLGAVRERRGVLSDRRGALLTDRVPRAALRGLHRVQAYLLLATGQVREPVPAPRLEIPAELRERWRRMAGALPRPLVGVFPGTKSPARQWPPERFAELVRRLATEAGRVVVFGGPAERGLTRLVAGGHALDLGGRTDLPLLAAGLADCDLVVSNDTGPLHIAAAAGTPTVSFWGAGDPRHTAPPGGAHTLLRHPELPCVPCVRNQCPRRGRGYVLPEAERECLALIEVSEAESAVRRHLASAAV